VTDCMEKVANKVKEMAKDVERAAKSMMYNLE
jgi:BMFP domain-containing protein YqiC